MADGSRHNSSRHRPGLGLPRSRQIRHHTDRLSPTRGRSKSPVQSRSRRALTCHLTRVRHLVRSRQGRSYRLASWNRTSRACRRRRLLLLTLRSVVLAQQGHHTPTRSRGRNNNNNNQLRARVPQAIPLSLLMLGHLPEPQLRLPRNRARCSLFPFNNPSRPTSRTWHTIPPLPAIRSSSPSQR